MLLPPLTLQDISMLFAVSAILLLVTAELASSASRETTYVLDMKKLRNLAIALGILFLVTVAITIFNFLILQH
jgi:hypothetical protein